MTWTPWHIDGFEHGRVASAGTGVEVYDAIPGPPTIVTSPVRTGSRALSIAAAGAACRAGKTLPASTRQVAMSFYVRFATLPSAVVSIAIFANANGTGQFRYSNATGTFQLANGGVGNSNVGPTVATNTWYLVDLSYDSSTGTVSITGQIDRGVEVSVSRTQTAADCTAVSLGTASAETYTAYYDDWTVSLDITEHPCGAHHVESLIPNADLTHNITTLGDFDSFTGTAFSNATTNGNTFIGHRPLQMANTANQVIRQDLGTAAEYMEFAFENLADNSLPVHGVKAFGAWVESSGTGASGAEIRLLLAAGTEVLVTGSLSVIDSTEDPGVTVSPRFRLTIAPSGGWDGTKVDGLKARVGFGDNDPDVNFIDLMLEVLVQEVTNAAAAPAKVSGVAAIATPSIDVGTIALPAKVSVVAALPSPSIPLGATVTPSRIAVVAAVPHPSVTTGILPGRYGNGYGGYELPAVVPPPVIVPPRLPTPDLNILIDFVNDLNPPGFDSAAASPVWTDVSDLLRAGTGFSTSRGRQRPLDKNESGTAIAVFDNHLRQFDPESADAFGETLVMRHIRAEAVFPRDTTAFKMGSSKTGGTDLIGGGESFIEEGIFDGYIESVAFDYPNNGNDATATVRCIDQLGIAAKDIVTTPALDFFYDWGALNLVLNDVPYAGRAPGSQGTTIGGDRDISESVLTSAGEPKFILQLGTFTQASLREPLDAIVSADGGNLFVDRNGRWVYRDRHWSAQPDIENLRVAVDAELFTDISRDMDETLIYNHVELTGPQGTAVVEDIPSQSRYLRRDYTATVGIAGATDLLTRAEELLLRHREPSLYLRRLDFNNVTTDWRAMLTATLWDIVNVEVPLPNGDLVIQRSMIEGIEITTANRQDWQMVWWLSMPSFANVFDDDNSSFEGADGLGTTGFWEAETNCVLRAEDSQLQRISHRHGGAVDHYFTYTFEPAPVYAKHGAWVLEADVVTDGDVKALSGAVEIEARRTYVGEAWLRLVGYGGDPPLSTNPATDLFRSCRLEIDWFDINSVYLSTDNGVSVIVRTTPITSWVRAKVDARAPNAAAFAKLRIHTFGSARAGVYIDAVELKRGA